MKILVDMNLSPTWVEFLATHGIEATHWSQVGEAGAKDAVVMEWARGHGYIVFTHDLDFSAIAATTGANAPSVIQMRTQRVLPASIGGDIVGVLRRHADVLQEGAIVTVDEAASRVRILPVRRNAESGS